MISTTYTGQIYDAQSSTEATTTTSTDNSLGQDAFLKMFMAQITNQNPLDPMDNTEFTAQLATFSQLEQLTKISGYLEGMEDLEAAVNQTTILGYIGKEVALSGNLLPVSQGYVGGATYTLASDADVVATIYDSNGSIVTQLSLGWLSAGTQSFQWDGTDSDGQTVADGVYNISISAADSAGNSVTVSDMVVTALVTGYQKDTDGTQYLLMGDVAVLLSDVLAVRNPAVTTTSTTSSTSSSSSTSSTDSTLDSLLESLVSLGGVAALLL